MSTLQIKERIQIEGADIGMPCIAQLGFDGFNKPIPLDEHQHLGFEFTYIDNGLVTWELGDRSILKLNGNDMALTQPNTPHKGQFDVISPASLFWISFDFSMKNCLKNTCFSWSEMCLMQETLLKSGNFSHFAGSRIPFQLQELHRTLKLGLEVNGHNMTLCLLRSQLNLLFVTIIQEISNLHSRQETSYSELAKKYIEQNIDGDINVASIAEVVNISVGHLHEVFKKDMGITPAAYIQVCRCEKAKLYLVNTNKNITDITFELGFNSTQYFATCFRKYTGLTPSQFRERR